MDTEKLFINGGSFETLTFSELTDEETAAIKRHVELTRHLQEIRQLQKILCFYLDTLTGTYTLMNSGQVYKSGKPANAESDYIALNAHTISIASAARTLTESMECYMKENHSTDDPIRKTYLTFASTVYDSSFAYRLMIRLRDFSQHGHLLVSCQENNYCIDLYQILHKPHFHHNPTIRTQLTQYVEEIIRDFQDTPTLGLAMTLAEFTADLFSVYSKFWNLTEDEIRASHARFCEIADSNPQNINGKDVDGFGLFVYDYTDNIAHAVHMGDDTMKMFRTGKNEAEQAHKRYEKEWLYLKGGMRMLRSASDDLKTDSVECSP